MFPLHIVETHRLSYKKYKTIKKMKILIKARENITTQYKRKIDVEAQNENVNYTMIINKVNRMKKFSHCNDIVLACNLFKELNISSYNFIFYFTMRKERKRQINCVE